MGQPSTYDDEPASNPVKPVEAPATTVTPTETQTQSVAVPTVTTN